MRKPALGMGLLILTVVFAGTAVSAISTESALHKASDLMGLSVQNANGQKIGTIVDLVLDRGLNQVTHAVFAQQMRGEWAHFAIPFDQLKTTSGGDAIVLDVDAMDLSEIADTDLRASRVWFQGPIDVEWRPVEERTVARGEGMIDIYGRPIEGKARTPYVQNVYEMKPGSRYSAEGTDFDRTEWRGYQRDQYGRPLFERDYYVGDDTYGHNGYKVEEQMYGRPVRPDLYRGDSFRPYSAPSRSDWRWGDGVYGRPRESYDRYGRSMERDYGRYGQPLYRSEYDRYGRPLYGDRWVDRTYGRPRRDMGSWFKTDWSRDSDELGMRRVSSLLGMDVAVRDADAGYIDDFAIDMRTGHVAYMLVSLSRDFANAPNRMAAIPWEAVDLMPRQNLASVDISRSALLDLAFRSDEMPELYDSSYARRLYQHFDVTPYWETYGYVSPGADFGISGSAWDANSWYAMSFDPENVGTFSGRIESISTFKPSEDASAGLRLRLRTDDGRLLLVNAGPFNFVNQRGMEFARGDRITVTGSPAQIAGQNVILASMLSKDNQTVQLRTRQGRPLW